MPPCPRLDRHHGMWLNRTKSHDPPEAPGSLWLNVDRRPKQRLRRGVAETKAPNETAPQRNSKTDT